MKKILTTLLLSALSVLSFAQGRQAGRGISDQTVYDNIVATPDLGLPEDGSYDGIHPAVNVYDDMERILTGVVAKVLNMENNFYTLPSDEADSRKLASDADRSCEAL